MRYAPCVAAMRYAATTATLHVVITPISAAALFFATPPLDY